MSVPDKSECGRGGHSLLPWAYTLWLAYKDVGLSREQAGIVPNNSLHSPRPGDRCGSDQRGFTAYRSFHQGFLTLSNRHSYMICLTECAGRTVRQFSNVSRFQSFMLKNLNTTHAGPIKRNCRSLKKDGFLPSMWWPMNCPIQAATKTTRAMVSKG